MPKQLATPPPPSRYSYERVTEEIERQISARGVGTQKQVAQAINLTEAQFSHRMRGAFAKFSVEHFGAIADYFDAPRGWPLIPWIEAAERDEMWKAKSKKRK